MEFIISIHGILFLKIVRFIPSQANQSSLIISMIGPYFLINILYIIFFYSHGKIIDWALFSYQHSVHHFLSVMVK